MEPRKGLGEVNFFCLVLNLYCCCFIFGKLIKYFLKGMNTHVGSGRMKVFHCLRTCLCQHDPCQLMGLWELEWLILPYDNSQQNGSLWGTPEDTEKQREVSSKSRINLHSCNFLRKKLGSHCATCIKNCNWWVNFCAVHLPRAVNWMLLQERPNLKWSIHTSAKLCTMANSHLCHFLAPLLHDFFSENQNSVLT